jgi:hypothetical protein
MLQLSVVAQTSVFIRTQDSVLSKLRRLPRADSLLGNIQERFASPKTNDITAITDTPHIAPPREMHLGWADGRVWEYAGAYTISRHEWRLNIFGPSSFGLSNKVELKSYPWILIAPNLSVKYKFLDVGGFAMAIEPGVAGGGLPIAAGAGILLPGAALGGGTVGLISFSDVFLKLYGSWQLSSRFTFSLRAGASHIKSGYYGLGGFAGIGKDGEAAGLFPVGVGLIKTNWLMVGFEADYVINSINIIVLKASIGKLYTTAIGGVETHHTSDNYLMWPSLFYTHAWKHLHLSAGLYGAYDPPQFVWLRNSKLPVSPFANVYWVLNNRKRK